METGGRDATDDIKKECSKNYADAVVTLCMYYLFYFSVLFTPVFFLLERILSNISTVYLSAFWNVFSAGTI